MDKKQLRKLTSFFYEIGTLRRILRAHQQALLVHDPTDNIASHSFRSAFIGYFMAEELRADADKVLKMCLLHDIEEIRTNDHNWIHRRYTKVFDDEVRQEQLDDFPGAKDLLEVADEYAARQTPEARIAKDADLLDQLFLLKEYAWQGNREAARWLDPKGKEGSQQERQMHTALAKSLAKELKAQDPSLWWKNIWTAERRN